MIKLIVFIIPILINLIVFFTEEFDKIIFLILFNLFFIFIFIINRDLFKNKVDAEVKLESEDNKQETADDHPIIISARKRLKKN